MPNVGLALDAEWKLQPGQLPLRQIGSVSINEVNSVVTWLAGLTASSACRRNFWSCTSSSCR